MDNEKRKKLKQDYTRLVGKLERVLKRFTPLDPSDDESYGDEYDQLAPTLVSMLMRGCDREQLFTAVAAYRANYYQPVAPNAELEWKIADAVLKAFLNKDKAASKPPKSVKPLFHLDLRIDFEELFHYVAEQVRLFNEECTIAGTKRVYLVEFGYEYAQAGWATIHFDTRPDAQSDGSWSQQIDKRRIERPHWRKACAANMRGPINVVVVGGKDKAIPEGAEIEMAEQIGLLLKAVLMRARDEGLLSQLPLAPQCQLAVEIVMVISVGLFMDRAKWII